MIGAADRLHPEPRSGATALARCVSTWKATPSSPEPRSGATIPAPKAFPQSTPRPAAHFPSASLFLIASKLRIVSHTVSSVIAVASGDIR